MCRTCVQNKLNKPSWGEGPWQHEPNRVEFEHAGFPCVLHRNEWGSWCGYVGVFPDHPCHGKNYRSVDVYVHGGLTYTDNCQGCIYHVPKTREPENLWWFGFDCGHSEDYSPELEKLRLLNRHGTSYRDQNYVTEETKRLAEQLKALQSV